MTAQAISKPTGAEDTNQSIAGSTRARVPTSLERTIGNAALPLIGIVIVLLLWAAASATVAQTLPSPSETWEASRLYVLEPFAKRGELDQGILLFTWYSLQRVAKGYVIAILLGAPIGFLLGMSKLFRGSFDP